MITFGTPNQESMKDTEKCLDPQLWHACAGAMVQMPATHSTVYYFSQGHAEHAQGVTDFGKSPRIIPALILCRVVNVKFMADPETDEVSAKIRLVPIRASGAEYPEDDELGLNGDVSDVSDVRDKPTSFAKTLTQSDANNGGGFSVPRYCAETIFPRLDYSADPPVQTVLAKDVHGEVWKFRHIYRGTPRRHLLTTGWSAFVNQKKLVAGDSIVFLRAENGELCVGIRRAKRVMYGGSSEFVSGWTPPGYGGLSSFMKDNETRLVRGGANGAGLNASVYMRGRGKVSGEAVVEAANLAASGQPFEVVYYPRASTPEFVVKAASVRAAMRIQWCPGMRFKMAFETEDLSRISWFMGTISSVQVVDPIRWSNSPWRLLQVTWDEPDLLQNVKCVSPWLVELVSSIPPIHLSPFSPPRKKLRVAQHADFPFDGPSLNPLFQGNPLGPSNIPLRCFADNPPASIQGARHAQFGVPISDFQLNKLHLSLLHGGAFNRLDNGTPPTRITTGFVVGNAPMNDTVSCLLTIGTPPSAKKPESGKTGQLVLFGKPILTEQQMSMSSSGGPVSPGVTRNSLSNENAEKTANGSGSSISLGSDIGHCKVFMESEDIGRTIDLSLFGSYEELYMQLADMFGIDKDELTSHVIYRDDAGVVKHTGDEPFSEFVKAARRLTIVMDASGSDNFIKEQMCFANCLSKQAQVS